MSATHKIAIIIGSTRTPRIGLPISELILKHLSSILPVSDATSTSTPPGSPSFHLELLDLLDHQLPYFCEPGIPQHISDPSSYTHASTRAWSTLISSYSAFVFVTPQYNWGIPGGLKNNIDYLYNEWKGKPAMVVSYGGRGGGKAGEQLVTMLKAMKVAVAEERVELNLNLRPHQQGMAVASLEGRLVEGMDVAWELDGELGKARWLFEDMVGALLEKEEQKGP